MEIELKVYENGKRINPRFAFGLSFINTRIFRNIETPLDIRSHKDFSTIINTNRTKRSLLKASAAFLAFHPPISIINRSSFTFVDFSLINSISITNRRHVNIPIWARQSRQFKEDKIGLNQKSLVNKFSL